MTFWEKKNPPAYNNAFGSWSSSVVKEEGTWWNLTFSQCVKHLHLALGNLNSLGNNPYFHYSVSLEFFAFCGFIIMSDYKMQPFWKIAKYIVAVGLSWMIGRARNKKIYIHIAFQESHTENWVAITTFYRGVNLGTNSRTGIGSMGVISAVKDAWILSVSKIPQSSGCLRRSWSQVKPQWGPNLFAFLKF